MASVDQEKADASITDAIKIRVRNRAPLLTRWKGKRWRFLEEISGVHRYWESGPKIIIHVYTVSLVHARDHTCDRFLNHTIRHFSLCDYSHYPIHRYGMKVHVVPYHTILNAFRGCIIDGHIFHPSSLSSSSVDQVFMFHANDVTCGRCFRKAPSSCRRGKEVTLDLERYDSSREAHDQVAESDQEILTDAMHQHELPRRSSFQLCSDLASRGWNAPIQCGR